MGRIDLLLVIIQYHIQISYHFCTFLTISK